jgi:uncharacterized protein
MRRFLSTSFLVLTIAALGQAQCVSLTAPNSAYTQNFDTLAATGTSSTVPAGWSFAESGTSANTTYTAGTGSANTGDTYSFGAAGSTDRAFGGLQSGALIPTIGACFVNNTGVAISSLQVSYTGEEWRLGTANRADQINFQYSTDATSITTGTWTGVAALDFTTPSQTGTAGARDGNAAANRTAIGSVIGSLNIPNGATFYIRWNDFNASGADDGLAVDDFSLIPNPAGLGLSINDVSLAEGNSGTTNFTFTVSLTGPAGAGGVSFDIATADGTATAGSDYVAQSLFAQSIPQGSSTYTFTVLVNGDTVSEANETFFVNITNVTGASILDGQGQGTILNDDFTCTATQTIAQIQGNTGTSPFANTTQTTTGIVTYLKSNGFFLQMPSPGDGDPATSDGIFVFTSSAPTVAVGDSACVTGTITEFTNASTTDPANTLTEIGTPTVLKLSSNNALPAPVTLSPDPNGAKDQFERYESMRVQVANLTVVAPTGGTVDEVNATSTSNGAFWGVVQGVNRPFREPGVEVTHPIAATLPACCIPLFDGNPERIQVFTGNPGVTKIDVTVGANVANVAGTLDVFFGDYEIDVEPATVPTVSNNNLTFTAVPTPLASELTVATANLERFFDTTDDPAVSDVVLTSTAFANRLKKASLEIRNVLKTPDVVSVEEMENLTTLQSLSAQISSDAIAAGQPDPQYQAFLVEGNDIGGIDVGFLAKSSRVSVTSVTQFGKATTYTDPNTNQQAILNDRPPLVLTGVAHNGALAGLPFTVIANHLKALPADDPTDTRVRVKREAQAEFLANLIQARQVANPNELIISVGDYNAFEFNDGLADVIGVVSGTPAATNQTLVPGPVLVNPALTELSTAFLPANARYSYSFGGNAQAIDHILANQKALARVTRFAVGHSNADFPEVFRNDVTRPERLSDHDAEVAYLSLPAAVDVTSSVSYAASGLVYNRASGLYNGSITVTNNSASTITGPIQIALANLSSGVTLSNATGNLGGTPYITPAGSLAAGASVTIPVQFRNPGSARISYTINIYSGTL